MLGRAESEWTSSETVRLGLQLRELCGATLGDRVEDRDIDGDSNTFHLGQDGHKWQLKIRQQAKQVPASKTFCEHGIEAANTDRLTQCVPPIAVGLHCQPVLAQQIVKRVAAATWVEQVRRQGGVERRGNSLCTESPQRNLGIVRDQARPS